MELALDGLYAKRVGLYAEFFEFRDNIEQAIGVNLVSVVEVVVFIFSGIELSQVGDFGGDGGGKMLLGTFF